MTERLHRLTMRSFRGVPGELAVDFGDGQSLVVYGDNGTGKSTIADALEWFFTGEIELLSHEGRQHAIRNLGGAAAGDTAVELLTSGALGGKVVLPDERGPDAFDVASRETFLLRGRTLADFINKTKTEKWKALAELLGLDSVELLRQDLQRARGDLKKRAKAAAENVEACRRALSPEGGAVGEEEILSGLKQICRGLGVEAPETLDRVAEPGFLAKLATGSGAPAPPPLDSLVASLSSPAVDREAVASWNGVVSSEASRDLARLSFLRSAEPVLAALAGKGACPLCGQSVDLEALAARVREMTSDLFEASRRLETAREAAEGFVSVLAAASGERRSLREEASRQGVALPEEPVLDEALSSAIERRAAIDVAAVETFVAAVSAWNETARQAIASAATAGGDRRPTQLAMLAALSDQIRAWRAADRESARAKRALDVAERIYQSYERGQKEQLEAILESISRRVAEIYEALHPGEELGGISVEPWTAKGIELAIQFHGKKQRPPHGVLSESHLNSLAIALFLAMAQTFNEKLRFLVLDDVINSFDVEHRAQLATLLAEKFDDWQLIVLTHDRQFFEHLWRRAPNWKRLEIASWSYQDGPRTTTSDSRGTLAEAKARLAEGDGSGAAMKGRRALEELLQETCEELEAELPFRRGSANEHREIGQLLKGLRRALKQHAKGLLSELDGLLKNLDADVQATLNVEAHASRGRAGIGEVEASLRRIEELDSRWTCPECGTRVWHKGTPESSRCRCGKSSFPPSS